MIGSGNFVKVGVNFVNIRALLQGLKTQIRTPLTIDYGLVDQVVEVNRNGDMKAHKR